jgi:hypothetical protein
MQRRRGLSALSGLNLTQNVIEGGKSAQLRAQFELLDQTEANGRPKFQPSSLRWVRRIVSCRSYAPPLHELCHLLRMAETRAGGACDLLWTPMTAQARNIRSWFRQQPAARRPGQPAVEVDDTCIRARYRDGRFEVSYHRAADLIALGEFLVTALGFAELDDALARLTAAGDTAQPAADVSNALARSLYAYLADHLPSVQDGRLTRHLVDWLEGRGGGLDTELVDDEAILAFWEAKGEEEGLRSYGACVRLVLRTLALIDAAATQRALGLPRAIGSDAAAEEVDPADVETLAAAVAPDDDPLVQLTSPPADAAKPLNARERARLAWPVAFGALAPRLLLTLLRVQTFGAWQARLAHGNRNEPSSVAGLLDQGPDQDYAGALEEFQALASHIDRVRLAALAALLRAQHPGALDYLVRLAPAEALASLADGPAGPDAGAGDGGGRDTPAGADDTDREAIVQTLLTALTDGRTGHQTVDRLMADAAKALRAVSRQGFKPPYAGDALSAAEAPLDRLSDLLGRVLAAAARSETDWADRYAGDRARFTRALTRFYSGALA